MDGGPIYRTSDWRNPSEFLAGSGPGVPNLHCELRFEHRTDGVGSDQRGHTLRRERLPWQRVLLLPGSQHGRVPGVAPRAHESGSVLRQTAGRLPLRRTAQEGSPFLFHHLRASEPGRRRHSPIPGRPNFRASAASSPATSRETKSQARLDVRINEKNSLFLRYSHDGNYGFIPPAGQGSLPSNWSRNSNWADQSIVSLTTALRPNLINELRFSYWYWHTRNRPPTQSNECPGECIGLGIAGDQYSRYRLHGRQLRARAAGWRFPSLPHRRQHNVADGPPPVPLRIRVAV